MPASALGLALAAALVHAVWNLLLARTRDPQPAVAVALVVAVVVWAPVALVTGGVTTAALPYIGASAALDLVYFALLATAYRVGELSVTYPLARGLDPVLLVGAGLAGIGGAVGLLQVAGVGLVAVGIVAVRGMSAPGGLAEVVLATGVAACIAGCTLIDRAGLRHAAPIAYLWLVLALTAVPYAAVVVRTCGWGRVRAQTGSTMLAAGVAIFAAYVLVLAALRLAGAAAVGAVRETSVVLVAILAALVLREPVGLRRGAGAVVVAGGIVLIAVG